MKLREVKLSGGDVIDRKPTKLHWEVNCTQVNWSEASEQKLAMVNRSGSELHLSGTE